jgi:hypothetical protein
MRSKREIRFLNRCAVDFCLIMAAITPRSDSGNVSRTSINLARPSDVQDEFDFDVADPHLYNLITAARALACSGMSLGGIATNEELLDDNRHHGHSTTRIQERFDIPASTILRWLSPVPRSKPSAHRNSRACSAAFARGRDAISCNAACGIHNRQRHTGDSSGDDGRLCVGCDGKGACAESRDHGVACHRTRCADSTLPHQLGRPVLAGGAGWEGRRRGRAFSIRPLSFALFADSSRYRKLAIHSRSGARA